MVLTAASSQVDATERGRSEVARAGLLENGDRSDDLVSQLACVAGEYEVAIFRRLVAREAGLVQRLAAGFVVREVGETPAAGRGVLFRVLDHELDVHAGPGDEGLEARAGKAGG